MKTMQLNIKKLHKNAIIPEIATIGAACVDVVATEIVYKPGDNTATVKLGFATAIPEGYKACLSPRSSFTKTTWMMQNSPAQIDSDYRGEWMLRFRGIPCSIVKHTTYGSPNKVIDNLCIYSPFPYQVGDRVAQMWLEKIVDFEFKVVEELDNTSRGEGGFGSTGK